jgi:multidrug efflux pump subunit AcrA (membrane-fusion protein)
LIERSLPLTPKQGNTFPPQKRKIIPIAAFLVIAALLAGYFYYSKASAATENATGFQSQTSMVRPGDLTVSASGTGTIIAQTDASFGFDTSGQVTDVDVKVGDQVEAGQVLAQLDDTLVKMKYDEAQRALQELYSAASIAQIQQEIATAQDTEAAAKEWLAYLISPDVAEAQENLTIAQQKLNEAQAAAKVNPSEAAKQKVTEAQTSLTYAQNELKYFQTVYEETYIPENFTQYLTMTFRGRTVTEVIQVEDEDTGKMVDLITPPTESEIGMARAAYDLAKITIGEAQTYLDVLIGEEIPEGATGANLKTYIETEHALETAEYNLNATQLTAPFSGTVTALDMSVADRVNGETVITVSNLDQPYSLDAYLDAEEWGSVKEGYEVEVSFDILPDQVFKGVVTNVYPTLDTSSANKALVHVTARLDDAIAYDLPAGAAASVDVIGGRTENAVLVPVEALCEIGEGQYTLFVFSIMQSQVQTVGGTQNGSTETQRGDTTTNQNGNFGPGGGGFVGGPPPDGGFPGGNPNFQGQRNQSNSTTGNANSPAAVDPNRIPTPLVQAIIEYLKSKAAS